MLPEVVVRYLQKRSIPGPWELQSDSRWSAKGAVVIPSLAESASLPETLASLAADNSLIESGLAVVVVVNNRLDAGIEIGEDNRKSLAHLHRCRKALPFPLGIVDASSPGLELPDRDGGVGFARKLGHDLVLPFLDFRAGDPVIISLDADTLVEHGYAGAVLHHLNSSACGGAVIPFQHLPAETPEGNRAIERYELFLRSYVAGLDYAGSPYAFHTVGSAMACRVSAYLKCGGMNRRRAGEDFYFIQSLAKTTGIAQVTGTVVHPSARRSTRVPFGTGRAVGQLLDQQAGSVLFYPADSFELLRIWMQLALDGCSVRDPDLPVRVAERSQVLAEFLGEQGFGTAWAGFIDQHRTAERLAAAFHGWFDAFRTMKLFHYLADHGLPRGEPEVILPGLPHAWGGADLCLQERLRFLRSSQNH